MKTYLPKFNIVSSLLVALCIAGASPNTLEGANLRTPSTVTSTTSPEAEGESAATADRPKEQDLKIRVLESDPMSGQSRNPQSWLGLATEEASEALVSQLQLDPGVGLTVTYVAPDSPAAKAGLQKNDVLVGVDNQALVHPAQLRKLVQVRKDGDAVKLAYIRAGKKESVSVTLAKAPERGGLSDYLFKRNEDVLRDLQGIKDQIRGEYGDTIRDQMKSLMESLSDLNIDKDRVQKEVRHSMEEARKTMEEALRHTTNAYKAFGPAAKAFEDLARGWGGVSKDASVTIHSSGSSAKTMVKADETGTFVLLANPRKHLTVHDKEGKLLFDGEIETPEQQAKVPQEIWQKAEPMANKMGVAKEALPELESKH